MKRRSIVLGGPTQFVLVALGSAANSAQAFLPPAVAHLARVFITVAFERYVVGPILRFLARLFPRLFASERRRYLMAVAVALGIEHAQASVLSEKVEDAGAVDLARNGYIRLVNILIRNEGATPAELTDVQLALVDVQRNQIELVSESRWGLVVAPNETLEVKVECGRFPSPGIKRWHVIQSDSTLAISEPFQVLD